MSEENNNVTDLAEVKPKRKGGPGRPKGAKDKKRRKKPYWLINKPMPLAEFGKVGVKDQKEIDAMEDGTNKRIMEFSLRLDTIRQQATRNRDIINLRDCFNMFKALCYNTQMRPTNASTYYALGFSQQTFNNWRNNKRKANEPEYAAFADEVLSFCSMFREQLAAEGKIPPVTNIWWGKAYDGLSDAPKAETAVEEEREQKSAEEIAEKYKNIPID